MFMPDNKEYSRLMEAIPMCYELIKYGIKESVKHTLFIFYLLLNWLHVSTLQGHHQAFM
jgi:hypothetical protein